MPPTFCRVVPAIPAIIGLTFENAVHTLETQAWNYLELKENKKKKETEGDLSLRLICPNIASDWGCVLICGSYAPGLGQSGMGRPNADMEYVTVDSQLLGHSELMDENLNLDHLNGFGFSDFMQSYTTSKPQ